MMNLPLAVYIQMMLRVLITQLQILKLWILRRTRRKKTWKACLLTLKLVL